MPVEAIAYPHPVVGHGDDALGVLSCSDSRIVFRDGVCTIEFDELTIKNAALDELVRQRRACFRARLECDATLLRETFELDATSLPVRFSLPAARILDRVVLKLFVTALERIDSYRASDLNEDYGSAIFYVDVGDILAIGPEFVFYADKSFDPMTGGAPSIMRVRGGDFEGPFSVNYDGTLIDIEFGRSDWAHYQRLKQGGSEVLHATVVVPVLVEAIGIVLEGEKSGDDAGPYSELLWFQRLKAMLETRGVGNDEGHVTAAMRLLDNPFQRAAEAVLRQFETGDGS